MRFPLGMLSQYIGRKNATLVEMALIVAGHAVRLLLRQELQRPAGHGRAAGHRRAPASAWRCRWARAGSRRSTRAWRWAWWARATSGTGRVGAGRAAAGAVVRLAGGLRRGGRCHPAPDGRDDRSPRRSRPTASTSSFREHVACLFEKDGWAFSLIYGVTFGGFIGLTTFLPTYYYDQFGVTKVQAGQLTMLAALHGRGGARAWAAGSPTAGAASTR